MLTKTKSEKGFTIIEVMIVLAIAGLIMLIVFLAVPALQRNSRNTQRKNDVSLILGAMAEWSNNHNGQLPTDAQFDDAIANAKLGFYTESGQVSYEDSEPATQSNQADVNNVLIVKGHRCADADDGTSTKDSASKRQLVALYTIETGGGQDELCQES